MQIWRLTVRGTGQFPLDMLRYDQCWPSTQEDAARATGLVTGWRDTPVEITVTTAHAKPFTLARWKSFGWEPVGEPRRKL